MLLNANCSAWHSSLERMVSPLILTFSRSLNLREISCRLGVLGLLLGEESRKGDNVGVDLLLRWASLVTVGSHFVRCLRCSM
jgi:hypothetical protein